MQKRQASSRKLQGTLPRKSPRDGCAGDLNPTDAQKRIATLLGGELVTGLKPGVNERGTLRVLRQDHQRDELLLRDRTKI